MITFKNIRSDSLGIIFGEHPTIPTASDRTEYITVPGRDGKLTKIDESLEPIKIILEGHAECSRDELISYFSGYGNLVFDEYPDRYYEARISSGVEIVYPLGINNLLKFLVTIDCEPYSYLINNQLVIVNKNFTVTNTKNLSSLPYLKITGSGIVTIKKNSVKILEIQNVNGYVEIDSKLNSIFKGTTSMERHAVGDVPVIDVGNNIFNIEGNVSKVEIKYNWRLR